MARFLRRTALLALAATMALSTAAKASDFSEPWKNADRALVVDAYEYNSIDSVGLSEMRHYFDDLAVQTSKEVPNQPLNTKAAGLNTALSMSDWIYTDYFLLLARQIVQAAKEALRDFKYPITIGQTSNQVVDWINTTGRLAGGDAYTVGDLFVANQTHMLNTALSSPLASHIQWTPRRSATLQLRYWTTSSLGCN